MNGKINGGIEGYAVKLDVNWVEGALRKYEGSVDANGFASGVTYDAKNPSSTATWHSQYALRCVNSS